MMMRPTALRKFKNMLQTTQHYYLNVLITFSSYHINSIHFNRPFQNESKCEIFLWKLVLFSIWMKTDIHNKDFVLRLILKERLKKTRKWPVEWNERIAEVIPIESILLQPNASDNWAEHNTGNLVPYSLRLVCAWVLYRPTVFMNTEVLWDGAYGLESLSLTWKSNHLQM